MSTVGERYVKVYRRIVLTGQIWEVVDLKVTYIPKCSTCKCH